MGQVLQAIALTCQECLGRQKEDSMQREIRLLREVVHEMRDSRLGLCCSKSLGI